MDDERVVYSAYCTEDGNKEDETHEISKEPKTVWMTDIWYLHRYVSKWNFLHSEFGT